MNRSAFAPDLRPDNVYPFWAPRIWQGMRMGDLLRLLTRHGLSIRPSRIPMAAVLALCSVGNTVLHGLQQLVYGRRIRETAITPPPLFIVGHWRTGTTYLHELLACDDRFAAPANYECFAANHFLVSQCFMAPIIDILLPRRRLTDDVRVDSASPQEDEFAICSLGVPSPYLRIAFPGARPPHMELLDMVGVTPEDRERLTQAIHYFYQSLVLRHGRQLLIKSPVHTGRIAFLTELFPGARFIHLTRHPYDVFASTRRLWRSLDEAHGFHRGDAALLDAYVLACFERMYGGFEAQRGTLDPDAVCDVRYDDLVRDPVGTVRLLYERLGLDGFEGVRPAVVRYTAQHSDHRAASHELDAATKSIIASRWRTYFDRYGYAE